jgi:hypothetical protein
VRFRHKDGEMHLALLRMLRAGKLDSAEFPQNKPLAAVSEGGVFVNNFNLDYATVEADMEKGLLAMKNWTLTLEKHFKAKQNKAKVVKRAKQKQAKRRRKTSRGKQPANDEDEWFEDGGDHEDPEDSDDADDGEGFMITTKGMPPVDRKLEEDLFGSMSDDGQEEEEEEKETEMLKETKPIRKKKKGEKENQQQGGGEGDEEGGESVEDLTSGTKQKQRAKVQITVTMDADDDTAMRFTIYEKKKLGKVKVRRVHEQHTGILDCHQPANFISQHRTHMASVSRRCAW